MTKRRTSLILFYIYKREKILPYSRTFKLYTEKEVLNG